MSLNEPAVRLYPRPPPQHLRLGAVFRVSQGMEADTGAMLRSLNLAYAEEAKKNAMVARGAANDARTAAQGASQCVLYTTRQVAAQRDLVRLRTSRNGLALPTTSVNPHEDLLWDDSRSGRSLMSNSGPYHTTQSTILRSLQSGIFNSSRTDAGARPENEAILTSLLDGSPQTLSLSPQRSLALLQVAMKHSSGLTPSVFMRCLRIGQPESRYPHVYDAMQTTDAYADGETRYTKLLEFLVFQAEQQFEGDGSVDAFERLQAFYDPDHILPATLLRTSHGTRAYPAYTEASSRVRLLGIAEALCRRLHNQEKDLRLMPRAIHKWMVEDLFCTTSRHVFDAMCLGARDYLTLPELTALSMVSTGWGEGKVPVVSTQTIHCTLLLYKKTASRHGMTSAGFSISDDSVPLSLPALLLTHRGPIVLTISRVNMPRHSLRSCAVRLRPLMRRTGLVLRLWGFAAVDLVRFLETLTTSGEDAPNVEILEMVVKRYAPFDAEYTQYMPELMDYLVRTFGGLRKLRIVQGTPSLRTQDSHHRQHVTNVSDQHLEEIERVDACSFPWQDVVPNHGASIYNTLRELEIAVNELEAQPCLGFLFGFRGLTTLTLRTLSPFPRRQQQILQAMLGANASTLESLYVDLVCKSHLPTGMVETRPIYQFPLNTARLRSIDIRVGSSQSIELLPCPFNHGQFLPHSHRIDVNISVPEKRQRSRLVKAIRVLESSGKVSIQTRS